MTLDSRLTPSSHPFINIGTNKLKWVLLRDDIKRNSCIYASLLFLHYYHLSTICCFLPHYTWRYVCACIYVCNKYLRVYACSLSNPILLLLHMLASFHILTPTKHRHYSLDYHGLNIKLTIDLCRKLFKGLIDQFLNSLHSFFGSLQVPPSLYNSNSTELHYLSWSSRCIHSFAYAIVLVHVCLSQTVNFWRGGAVPLLCFCS